MREKVETGSRVRNVIGRGGLVAVQTFAVIVLLVAGAAAQKIDGEATKNQGSYLSAIPFAQVKFCTKTATGTPCSPGATLYTDSTLSTSTGSSIVVADANGNYHAYLQLGLYVVQVTDPATGITYEQRDVVVNAPTGLSRELNVKAYGALGDGVSNDTPAFVAAKADADTYGGCLWVPPTSSSYRVNLTHSSAAYPLCILGVPNHSVLEPYADGLPVIAVNATANSVKPMTLHGLVIRAHAGFTNSRGILFQGGYTGSTYVISDWHNLSQLDIDGTSGYNFVSGIEVQGRMIYSSFRDINIRSTSSHGIAIAENNTPGYDGAFNNNLFDKVRIGTVKGNGIWINYTRTNLSELVASSNVFTHGTIEGACIDTTVADCAGFKGTNTQSLTLTSDHLEDNGTHSGDGKGAHFRLTGTYAQGFVVAADEMTQGQYGTYVDATLAFGVIGGGNRVNVSTKPIYLATSHAQSSITILDDPKTAGDATIVADVNGDKHVFQPLLGAPPFYNQKSTTTDESVAGITYINLTNSSGRTLTTLSGGAPNQTVTLFEAGSGTTTLTHGTGTNNINLQPCAVNSLLTPGQSIVLQFNGTTWHIVGAPINVLCPTTIDVSGASRFGAITVGSLPSAASNSGVVYRVTDSTAVAAEGQTCVGGSSNVALAFSNGSVWKCF